MASQLQDVGDTFCSVFQDVPNTVSSAVPNAISSNKTHAFLKLSFELLSPKMSFVPFQFKMLLFSLCI